MSDSVMPVAIASISLVVGSFLTAYVMRDNIEKKPFFTVTELVQCRGNICNAVLDMDDIAILIPYDSTKVHVGDKIYLVK